MGGLTHGLVLKRIAFVFWFFQRFWFVLVSSSIPFGVSWFFFGFFLYGLLVGIFFASASENCFPSLTANNSSALRGGAIYPDEGFLFFLAFFNISGE